MRTYNFNPILKGTQEAERALAAIRMMGNGVIKERAFAMAGATSSTVAYMTKLGITSAAELKFAQKLKLSTMAIKEKAVAWAASPMGMATIAATTIFAIVKAVDYFSSASERAAEELAKLESEFEELQSKINDASNKFKSLKSSADTVIPRFAELAKGVDVLGNNVSLTDEEYTEFLNLNNQIAEMFPQLNMGMDSNGNAMLSLSYTADTLAESLWNVIEAERVASNQTIADTMPNVISNIDETVGKYRDKIGELSDTQSEYIDTYNAFLNRSLPTSIGQYSTLESGLTAAEKFIAIAKELGIQGNVLYDNQTSTNNGYAFSVEWDYTALDHKLLLEEVSTQYEIALQKYNKLINDYSQRINAKWRQLNPVVSSWLQTDFMYQDLDGTMQEIAQAMVSGLDFGSLGLKTQEDVQNYVQTHIVEPLFLAAPTVKDAFARITDWKELLKNGEITFEQFSDYITDAFGGLFEQMDSGEIEAFKTIFVNAFNQIGIAGDDFDAVLANLITEWGKIPDTANAASESLNVFASVSEKLAASKENIDSLADAMVKLSDGTFEVWDVVELIEKFPELAGYVDLTADGFGNLDAGLRALARSELKNFIDEMQEFKETHKLTEEQTAHVDALCDSLANLATDSVQNLSGEFGLLAEQIEAATIAQTELEKKLSEDDYDAGYEDRVKAFGGFQEVLGAGEYGSKAYAAYKEYFGLMEKSPEQIKAWMQSNEKYFAEGTDGVLAFLQTIESMSGSGGTLEGIASFNSDTGEFWYDINELSAFANQLGWTEEMLQDFIYKYRMYCDEWESRSPADSMKDLTNAGLISTEYADFGPTIASLQDLMEYTGLSEQGVYNLIDSINALREQEGLPNISLIGRDITEITQTSITQWQNLGATAEEVSALLIELASQDVKITPNLYIDTEDGTQIDVDTLLAEAGIEDSGSVHVEVDFTVDGEPAMAAVEATVSEVKAILGEGWEAKLTANTVDAETGLTAVQTLLNELPASTDVLLTDSTGIARSSLSQVVSLLDTIENNNTKTVTIRYKTIGMPMFAEGTSRAKRGPALLGDEYSPTGSPKPELVVSDNTAYIAGADGPEIGFLNDGDVVYTADQTKRILHGNVLHRSIPAHAGGTSTDWAGLSSGSYGGSNAGNGSSSSNNSGGDEENWFERQYKDHQHWLEMDKESVSAYLDWLDDAYKRAYNEGLIDIDERYKYEEEILKKTQDLFKDHLNDIDHEISALEAGAGNSDEIIILALQAIADIEKELAAARAAGLDENGDYIQYLEQQWADYSQTVIDLREQAESEAKSSISDLVEYRIKMLKQEIEDQKDALNQKLDDLGEFYDKQREMLKGQYDEEKYLEEQNEKRKSVTDIQAELAMLEKDDSAWAQKRKLELQEELADAEKDLSDFERDHALDETLDMLDEQQAAQEAQIQAEIDALDKMLNDPYALYNQALTDIQNNTQELYDEFIAYNRKHGSGNDEDIRSLWEEAYKAYLEYLDTHNGELPGGIELGNYTGYVIPENPKPPEPTPPTNPETQTQPSTGEGTKPSLAYGSSIQVKESATHFGSKSGGLPMASFVPGGTYTVYKTSGDEVLIGRDGAYTGWINKSDIVGYASGTRHATAGLHRVDELGAEYIFTSPSDGSRYRMFQGGEKVLNAKATDFLYNFATSGGSIISKMFANLLKASGFGNIQKPVQAIELHSGDIIVQGNADFKTVSEIRRAQRDNLSFVLKELNKLNK